MKRRSVTSNWYVDSDLALYGISSTLAANSLADNSLRNDFTHTTLVIEKKKHVSKDS